MELCASCETSLSTLMTKSTILPARGKIVRVNLVFSCTAPRGKESIFWAGSDLRSRAHLWTTLTSCIIHSATVSRATHTNRFYVVQGCSSSGSLLCRVPLSSPAGVYISDCSLASPHVMHNNSVVERERGRDEVSAGTMQFRFEVLTRDSRCKCKIEFTQMGDLT